MRKYYCDRCGCEIEDNEVHQLSVKYIYEPKDAIWETAAETWDLCPSCSNDLRQFLREKEEKK